MKLDALAGNTALKRQLSAQCSGRGLSHAYLISGPEGSGKRTLARLMAAAMVCSGGGDPPCGMCPNCKKALRGIHPDIITLDIPEGKREILVEQARQMRADAIIRPNEAERKVYMVCSAQTMNRSAQNAILKLLEEGPAYAAFLLLAENPASMAPTIRSRCEEISLSPVGVEEAVSWLAGQFPDKSPQELRRAAAGCGGILGRAVERLSGGGDGGAAQEADALIRAFAARDELELMSLCGALERKKLSREAFCAVLDAAGALLRDALALESGTAAGVGEERRGAAECAARLPRKTLLKAADRVKKLRWDVDFNVNMGNLCAALCAMLGEAAFGL